MKNIFNSIKFKWLRETSLTIILIAIIIVAFIGINIGVDALDLTDIDLTEEKLYTLTDTSKEQISKIPEDENIEIYLFGFIENSSVADLIKQYIKVNDNISLEITTATDRADLAAQYDISDDDYYILIKSGDKYRLYDTYDLYITDYTTGNSTDITEQRITNGILGVSSIGTLTKVYMLTGHDEYSTDSYLMSFKEYLELENYEVNDLDLLVEEKVPEDCETIVIASPQKDITELEATKIKDYINAGGNILYMNDTYSAADSSGNIADLPNLKSILDLYGITLEQDGVVIEQDTSKMVMQTPDVILPSITSTEITEGLSTVMLLDASRIKYADDEKLEELGVTTTNLLTTSEQSFYRKDLSITSMSATDSDEVGEQVVGALLEKTIDDDTTSKLIIYANNAFATDVTLSVQSQRVSSISFYNNKDLILNSVAYLAEAEDQITVRKTIETVSYTATEEQNRIVMSVIFGVPVLIIIMGIIVWQLRRRKK